MARLGPCSAGTAPSADARLSARTIVPPTKTPQYFLTLGDASDAGMAHHPIYQGNPDETS